MHASTLLVALFLMLAGLGGARPVVANEPPDPPEIRSRLYLAMQLAREKRYEEALELFREMDREHPDQPKIVAGLKTCLLELKKYDDLVAILERELAAAPDSPALLEQRGTVAARQGDRAEALRWWRRILEVQRNSAGAHQHVADLLVRNRMLDEALAVYATADSLYPHRFTRAKAMLHELRFEFDEATQDYLDYLEFSPTALSFVEGRLLRIGESEGGLGGVIERVKQALADARAEAAADSAGTAQQVDPLVMRKLLGDLHLEAGDHEAARREYFRLLDEAPGQFAALLVFGKRCQTDGEHEVALKVFERIVAEYPQAKVVPSALTEIALCQSELGRWDDALATYERLMNEYPETDYAWAARLETAEILLHGEKDPQAAEQVFRELTQVIRGPWPEAEPQFGVAECALWSGDLERARGIYAAIGQRQFSELARERSLYEQARVCFYLGELALADSLFKQVAQQFPKGDHVNDALEFSILINTNQDGDEVLGKYAEARLDLRTGRPANAVLVLEGLTRDHPRVLIVDESLLLLGQALREIGRPREALDALTRAVEQAQVMDLAADAHLLRAEILRDDLEDRAAAQTEYETLLLTYPETLAADRARDLSADLKRVLP